LTEDQIALPEVGCALSPPSVIIPTKKANWPVKEAAHSSFEKALLGEVAADDGEPDLLDEGMPVTEEKDELGAVEEDEPGEGWDMGDDIAVDATGTDSDFVNVDNPDVPTDATGPGSSEADQ
ncbi:MAG: hypothetical protein M1823_008345, partial [Watsoniomyces obsoletus]